MISLNRLIPLIYSATAILAANAYYNALDGIYVIDVQYNTTFNIREFAACLGWEVDDIHFSTSDDGQYLIQPWGNLTYNESQWWDCLEEQDADTIISMSDGYYLDGNHISSQDPMYISLTTNVATNTSSGQLEERDNCCSAFMFTAFKSKGCNIDDNTHKSGRYWPAGCYPYSSSAYKSFQGRNYTGRKLKVGYCPHHDCRGGCVKKTVAQGGGVCV